MATPDSRITALEKIHLPQTPLEELLSHEMLDDDGRPLAEWEKLKLLKEALDEINVNEK